MSTDEYLELRVALNNAGRSNAQVSYRLTKHESHALASHFSVESIRCHGLAQLITDAFVAGQENQAKRGGAQ